MLRGNKVDVNNFWGAVVKKTQLQMIAEGLDGALDPCQPLQQKQSCMSIRLEFLKAFGKPYQTKNSDATMQT